MSSVSSFQFRSNFKFEKNRNAPVNSIIQRNVLISHSTPQLDFTRAHSPGLISKQFIWCKTHLLWAKPYWFQKLLQTFLSEHLASQ